MSNLQEILVQLSQTFGASGREDLVRQLIEQEIFAYVDEIKTDPLGNLVAVRRGEGRKIMMSAHMDEIALMITYIDEHGFLRFTNVGGQSPSILLGSQVVFGNGTIGAIYSEPLEDPKNLQLSKLYIDIGAKDREDAKAKVAVGDMAVFHSQPAVLGNRLMAKALDDRAGCAILIETIKRRPSTPKALYFVFSVQEEVGARGARTAAFGIDPDVALAVDITLTGDTPESKPPMAVELGKGPAIKVMDRLLVAHPAIKRLMVETAEMRSIPYQIEVLTHGGTDAGTIHIAREGIPSGVLSLPCRYGHTPNEMIDLDDLENAVKLLVALLENPAL
ncbi:MAG: M42 family metallopeptidase [Clostridia bacterium]|nr:M42 family metallopeptidase [Clostridia bacterium]